MKDGFNYSGKKVLSTTEIATDCSKGAADRNIGKR